MNCLELVPCPGEEQHPPLTERKLTIGISDIPHGCAVAAHVFERRLFSSVHTLAEQEELWETAIGKPRLTRDNPFLDESELCNLDDHGLIREGTRVSANEVLASILIADLRSKIHGRIRPARGMQWVEDRTWRVPAGWEDSIVITVRRLQRKELGRRAPRGLWERIEITLRAERALQIGDVLLIADRPLVVSSLINESHRDTQGNEADVIVSLETAIELGLSRDRVAQRAVGKSDQRAVDVLSARNIGPYSLISNAPLGRKPYEGQSITVAHIRWLRDRGYSALLGELSSLKSDDLLHRPMVSKLLEAPGGVLIDLSRPAAPESLAEVSAYLKALGLNVELQDCDDHVTVKVRPPTTAQIVGHSAGPISRPETIHYQTYEDMDDGLFAPNIFGPSSCSRRRRFGHFNLAIPVVPFLWRLGTPSTLSLAVGLGDDDLERVVKHQADVRWQESGPRVVERLHEQHTPEENNLGTGAKAIQAILTRRHDGQMPESLRCMPHALITEAIPILPPDWRPLVLLDSGNFATSDLNDLYRQVVIRSNRLKKLMDLHAPLTIIDNESRQLQELVDALHANVLLPETTAAFGDRGERFVDLLLLLFTKTQNQSKRVDWSAAARLVADASVPSQQVLVPRKIFETLRLSDELPILVTSNLAEGCFIALLPRSHDQLVLRVSPQSFAQLSGHAKEVIIGQIHKPITNTGSQEASRILHKVNAPVAEADGRDATEWIDSESIGEFAQNLAAAAASGSAVPLRSAWGLLHGGTGSIQLPADTESGRAADTFRQVAIPAEEPPRHSEPTFDAMLAVARNNIQKACVFDVRRMDQPPTSEQGRVGGEPFLPPDIQWPFYHGRPLPFLGQFPLDPARNVGVLPISVPPKSMMSVFGGEDCWQPGPCGDRCPIFIHSMENLMARPLPSGLEHPLQVCGITARIVDEIPAWNELREILDWELGNPKPGLLNEFHQNCWPQLPAAMDGIKIGGWAAWAQGADSSRPLLLQMASDWEAEFSFGSGGVLYIFVEEDGELFCFTQFD